jgi:protein disulfide-isomerase
MKQPLVPLHRVRLWIGVCVLAPWSVYASSPGASGSTASAQTGIAWHPGPPELALKDARQAHRPAFVFWSASWCPPCNYVKSTVFPHPAFVRQIQDFVAVTVDGDAEEAQLWAEGLGISAYPTMLIFSAAGREEYRIEGARPAEEVVALLADAASAPADEPPALTADAATGGPVTDAVWRALASGAWRSVNEDAGPLSAQVDRLYQLQARCPTRLPREKSLLFVAWLAQRASGDTTLTGALQRETERRLRAILRSHPLVVANLPSLTSEARALLDIAAPARDSRRLQLERAWLAAMSRAEADGGIPLRDRLSTLLPAIQFSRSPGEGEAPPLLEPQRAHIRRQVHEALKAATSGPLKQSIFSMAGSILRQAGMTADAVALYTTALAEAPEPYQFMLSLAALAKEAGRTAEATDWLDRAHRVARGRATRFQWGVEYVTGLVELAPDETERIEHALTTVLDEIAGARDASRGRNAKRFAQLKRAIGQWRAGQEPGRDLVDAVLQRLGERCVQAEHTDERTRCEAFVRELRP